MNSDLLRDKVIVVAGGTSGIGLAGVSAILAAGGNVVAVGKEDDHLQSAKSRMSDQLCVVGGDVCAAETIDRAIGLAVERFGRLDGLYHVAGGSGRRAGDGPLHEVSDEGWDFTIRLNLTSQFYSNRAAARRFLKQGDGGVVLNISSVLAWAPSPKHFSTFAYAAAKSAIIGMTKSAAACYAGRNIRFNAIAPGLVETPMSQRAMGDEQILRYVQSRQPLDGGRAGQAGDLDGAVVYLLSDQAKFVTGQVLAVDGGWGVSDGRGAE